MKEQDLQKLTILMLCEIMKKLDLRDEIDPDFVQSAIVSGNFWGLEWEYSSVFGVEETPPSIVTEVVDYIDMWSFLEEGYEALSKADKTRIADEADPFGTHVAFHGFDGNNESRHMSVARFLIDDMGRFARFKGRDLNSHSPSVEVYRRMFEVFEPIRKTLTNRQLDAGEIIAILKAQQFPEAS